MKIDTYELKKLTIQDCFHLRLKCTRCDVEWWPAKPEMPQTCPACRSPYWNKKRVKTINH